jgi:predicted site-specific integrase-resolvase
MSSVYRINEFAKRVGRSVQTVRRWEKEDLASQMVEDLMAIVHTFSGRLDGMRKYKKQLQDEFVEYKLGQVKDELQ